MACSFTIFLWLFQILNPEETLTNDNTQSVFVSQPFQSTFSTPIHSNISRTFAFIKPDAYKQRNEIFSLITMNGFNISYMEELVLDEATASKFYEEHEGRPYYPSLIKFMTSGPCVGMILEKENAISEWRSLIGPTDAAIGKITHPTSLRAIFGKNNQQNGFHGSSSKEDVEREIEIIFPQHSARNVKQQSSSIFPMFKFISPSRSKS